MDKMSQGILFLLRISMGWMFFYAGIIKILNAQWTSAVYLKGAKTFPELYQFFLQPHILPSINFINEWGLTLLGISLILGVCVRLSSLCGVVLMLLYYFPILAFPYPSASSYIVDQHIIFIFVLLYFASVRAGRFVGIEQWCSRLPLCRRFPRLRAFFG